MIRTALSLILVAGLLPVACSRGPARPPDAFHSPSITLSTNRVTVGDPVDIEWTVRVASNETVEADRALSAALYRISSGSQYEPLDGGDRLYRGRYRVALFDTGAQSVFASNAVLKIIGNDGADTVPLPPQVIEVMSVIDEGSSLRDVKSAARWPSTWPQRLAIGLAVLLALALALWGLSRYLSKPRTIRRQPPPVPPHVVAYRALKQLLDREYIQRGEVKPFYSELSDIVRRYLEDRFGLRAPELTTEEFIRAAADSPALNADQKTLVSDFLEQADLVKFARHVPGTDDMTTAADSARSLVDQTVPKEGGPDA